MKPALQALLIAPDHEMRKSILWGSQSLSIREGHRDYHCGPVMLCCHIVPWAVMADITSVRHCQLGQVTKEEYKDAGFHSQKDLLLGLQKFYPHLTMDSPVTVVRWEKLRGYLVEHDTEYCSAPGKLYAQIQHES